MMRKTFVTILYFSLAAAAVAQDIKTTPKPKPTLKEITIESIFDPKQRVARAGHGGGSVVQSRWPIRLLRARQRSLRGRRGHAARAPAHHRRQREHAQRHPGLGLSGGGLRTRQFPRVLVEPRLVAPRLHEAR